MSMMRFRSEDWQEVFGESSFPAGYEGDIADKILTDTYGEWWVWSGDEPIDDPDNWNYIHDGAEGLYLGVHEYVSFLSGDNYDEVPITNLTEDNKEEIRDFLGFAAETNLPGNITDLIMDEYLDEGESYEDSQEYARSATKKLKLDAEEDMILARMLEIEDMENPSAEDLDNLQSLESRYFELTGTFGAEDRPQFPAEALEELKKHIIVFTGAGMMLSVFAAVGGFLLGRRTKEC